MTQTTAHQVQLSTGYDCHLEVTGPDDAPVLLLSHGLLMDGEMFAPQVAAFSATWRVVTWDERGHGPVGWDGDFSYWDSAKDALAILDHLGVEKAVLGGMSQGGFLSLRAALLAPERVRALILLDTQAGPEDPAVLPGYLAMADDWFANGPNEDAMTGISYLILGPGSDDEPWKAKWRAMPAERAPQILRTLGTRDDITGRLGEITCPVLVVHGAADASIPLEKAVAMAAGLSGAGEVVVVEAAGHAANLTHPEPVNAAMTEFLAGLA